MKLDYEVCCEKLKGVQFVHDISVRIVSNLLLSLQREVHC